MRAGPWELLALSGQVLVHPGAQHLDVIADVCDHVVPVVHIEGHGLVVGIACFPAPIGGGSKGGAHGLPVLTEAVSDVVVAALHPDCLEGVLKVLAVILRDEGPQTEQQELMAAPTEIQQVRTELEH